MSRDSLIEIGSYLDELWKRGNFVIRHAILVFLADRFLTLSLAVADYALRYSAQKKE